MEILSHRGRIFWDEPGNQRKNFEAAYNLDVTGFETDIIFAKGSNKKIIVCHPGDDEASAMTLWDFLDMFREMPEIICCLEIKQMSEELLEMAIAEIAAKDLSSRVYITTFQRRVPFLITESEGKLLLLAKKLNSRIKTHVIVSWPFNLNKIAKKYNADAVSIGWLQNPLHLKFLSKSIFRCLRRTRDLKNQIKKLREAGIKVWAGICNDPDEMRYFARLGVDGIMTDNTYILKTMADKKKIL